jgi:hypothetical protein
MGVNRQYLILAAIFLLVLGVRLFFAFRTPTLTGDTSYFNLRQIESIRSTGFPIYNDPLSYSGRFYVFLPVFHYLIAISSLFLPLAMAIKIVPNLLISLTIFITYLISKEITKNEEASLVSALLSGFLPIIFYTTVNSLSAYSLILPLSFGILLCLMRVEQNKRYILVFIGLIFLMALTDSSILVLLFGFFVYLFLAWLERLSPNKSEFELISFSTLFVILLSLILFKNVLLLYGPDAIRQNIPHQLITQYFAGFNIFEAIYQIGVIPLVFGVYVVYKHLFVEKSRNLYVLISFALSLAILILLGLIELKIGLIYFSLVLSILSGSAYLLFSEYIKKTKFAAQYKLFVIGFLLLFVSSSLVPSLIYANLAVSESVSEAQINAFGWLSENTGPSAVILASEGEGHMIAALSKRKNVADTNFLLQKDAEQILGDIRTIYTTRFQTEAIRLLNKYNANYIILSNYEKEEYGIDKLSYVEGDCFKLVYDSDVKIYESRCVVEEQ